VPIGTLQKPTKAMQRLYIPHVQAVKQNKQLKSGGAQLPAIHIIGFMKTMSMLDPKFNGFYNLPK